MSLICASNGGPVFDYRIPKRSAGPFDSEKDFNDYLITQDRLRSPIHSTSHKITFTHADLNLTNILVDGNRLFGLVDFGCAGFYPEYWEFTKAKLSEFGPDPAWKNLVTAVLVTPILRSLRQSRSCGPSTRPCEWVLDENMTENVVGSQSIIVALQIGSGIDESQSSVVHSIITDTLVLRQGGFVPRWSENFRCCVWVKNAVERLRVAGFVPDCDVQDLEDEADSVARQAKNMRQRGVIQVSREL
ncbi:hypothetical protein IFR05_015392 [Cadophora sp. M221]|nr:hypothetical protein IFR05_015392 [Cadophora sp. M221]